MNRAAAGLLALMLLLCAQAAYAYVPPSKNLVIVEVDANGVPVEKKVAEEADLFFSREMKTMALFDVGGISSYEAVFTLNLQNVSKGALENVSLIETIPKEIAASASAIGSDGNFIVLDPDPVIKFALGTIKKDGVKRVNYRIKFSEEEIAGAEESFPDMDIPAALIAIGENDCTGIRCNDFNPCTIDHCAEGICVYDIAQDGMACGEGMACVRGKCEKFRHTGLLFAVGGVIIAIVLLSVLLIYKRRKHK